MRGRNFMLATLVLAGCSPTADDTVGTPSGPVLVAPGVISDEREQYRITFTLSGDTAYFAAGDGFFPLTRQATIYQSVRQGGVWMPPVPAAFSGRHADIDPFISPDGQRLYFSSIRPVNGQAREVADLWWVEWSGDRWGAPARLAISSEHDDLYPSVDEAGQLYFASPAPHPASVAGVWNIWVASPDGAGYHQPQPLGATVNSADSWEFNPAISRDGTRLIFTRLNRVDAAGTGFGELHVSRRLPDGTWSVACNLGAPVNTSADEYHPSLSPDEAVLHFVRRDPLVEGAHGDLYAVAVAAVAGQSQAEVCR